MFERCDPNKLLQTNRQLLNGAPSSRQWLSVTSTDCWL